MKSSFWWQQEVFFIRGEHPTIEWQLETLWKERKRTLADENHRQRP